MNTQPEFESIGLFDARYLAFLETTKDLRPSLHKYCAGMTGSIMDGEDVAQETLFEAYRKLDKFDDSRPLKPWIFGIAHNRCIDFLRKKKVRVQAETAFASTNSAPATNPTEVSVGPALERLVTSLPPMERAPLGAQIR
jgi:RNA polymerase sigma-70 factor (ECF subfamily)